MSIEPASNADRTEPDAKSPPPTGWWRFSLGSLFVIITLLAIALAWFIHGPDRQRRVVAELQLKGCEITYAVDQKNPFAERRGWLPIDYYVEVEGVGWDELAGPAITDDDFRLVGELKQIEQLCIQHTQVGDEGLAHLAGLEKPWVVQIGSPKVTDAGLTHIAHWTTVEYATFEGTSISDAGLAHLAGWTQLKGLYLKRTKITGKGIAALSGCTALERLDLEGCPIDDEGLAAISKLPGITHLDLSGSKVSDRGLVHLKNLPKLEVLRLEQTPVTARGLDTLAELPALAELDLGFLPIEDQDIDRLTRSKALARLDLRGTKVTKAVLYLELMGIRKLGLAETSVTKEQSDLWQRQFPRTSRSIVLDSERFISN